MVREEKNLKISFQENARILDKDNDKNMYIMGHQSLYGP